MKTTLTVLIAALFLIMTPLLASAHGGGQRIASPQRYDQGWGKDRHHDRHDYRRPNRPIYRVRSQHADYRSEPISYRRGHAAVPAVIIGVPRIIFRIGW